MSGNSSLDRGSAEILANVAKAKGIMLFGIKPGQTTPDGRYTLSTVECLGSCGTAPMMMVGDAYFENLTPASVDALLTELKETS